MDANTADVEVSLNTLASALNRLMANEFLLLTKIRSADRLLEGSNEKEMRNLFEEQCIQLNRAVDGLADRIRSIGHYPVAILKSFLALTHLTDQTRKNNECPGFVVEILMEHEALIKQLRGDISRFARELNDWSTSDLISRLIRLHEKSAWMLRLRCQIYSGERTKKIFQ